MKDDEAIKKSNDVSKRVIVRDSKSKEKEKNYAPFWIDFQFKSV